MLVLIKKKVLFTNNDFDNDCKFDYISQLFQNRHIKSLFI